MIDAVIRDSEIVCPACAVDVGRLEGHDVDGCPVAALRPGYVQLPTGPWAIPEEARKRLKQGRRPGRRPVLTYESGRGTFQLATGRQAKVTTGDGHATRGPGGPRLEAGSPRRRAVASDVYCWGCHRRLRVDTRTPGA